MSRIPTARKAGTVDVVVIGAGHAGLAMSAMLGARSIDHVVLERGAVANSWRTERWDSLRLLTPNWLARLPGYRYQGDDPDGYMNVHEVVAFISNYATRLAAPVSTDTTVTRVRPFAGGYRVDTDRGRWLCRAVVLANGAFGRPAIPSLANEVPAEIRQLNPATYRNPAELEDGGVLVVGASATGVQLADEVARSGRPVTISVGEHVRLPRNYRGRDILWWMDATGVSDQRIEEADDVVRARGVPSPQLVGSSNHRTIDLNALRSAGVETVGRLAGIRDGKALFSGGLRNVCALADLKMQRLLRTIDDWIDANGLGAEVPAPGEIAPTAIEGPQRLQLDLAGQVRTVIWATGFRPDFHWLEVPVFDTRGNLRHDRGIVDAPGLYVLGLPFLRRRKSSFIHGAEADVSELAAHLASYLEYTALRSAVGTAF